MISPSFLSILIFIISFVVATESFQFKVLSGSLSQKHLSLNMGIKLYGSQQTRSPLVNWYLLEKNIPFTQCPPRPNPNPFGQIPFMTDDGGVEIFESGAILLYLADAHGGYTSAQGRAEYTKVSSYTFYKYLS